MHDSMFILGRLVDSYTKLKYNMVSWLAWRPACQCLFIPIDSMLNSACCSKYVLLCQLMNSSGAIVKAISLPLFLGGRAVSQ